MVERSRRRVRCLKPEALRLAMRDELVWLKSEDIPEESWRDLYVDLGYIERIDNNSNHLISGRRGTGKTHLLQAFKQYVDVEKPSEIAIITSILNLSMKQTPLGGEDIGKRASFSAARNLFNQMLRYMFDDFLKEIDPFRKRLIGDQKNRVDNLLYELLSQIELGALVPRERDRKDSFDDIDGMGHRDGQARNSAKFGLINETDRIVATESTKTYATDTEISAKKFSGNVDHQTVRVLFKKILKICKIDVFHLLIDEWMELDKNTPSYIQNYFAQFLKKVFFGSNNVSVVIASIWNQTSLYERADMAVSQGLQIGHDIIHTVDLDTSLLESEEDISDFCTKILFRRLAKRANSLNDYENSEGRVDEVFITDIFDNQHNFRSYVAASHGIPRDIMKLFGMGTHIISSDFANYCIDFEVVNEVSQRIYRSEKRETIKNGSPAKVMWKNINDHMDRENSRLFLIKDGDQKTSSAFRSLIDHELIHEIPSATLPRWVRSEHRAYFVDYGNYVDWKKTKAALIDEIIMESILPSWIGVDEAKLDSMIVDVVPDIDLFVKCHVCDFLNDRKGNVFIKLGACVSCAEKILESGQALVA
jgi:hypothetical protein